MNWIKTDRTYTADMGWRDLQVLKRTLVGSHGLHQWNQVTLTYLRPFVSDFIPFCHQVFNQKISSILEAKLSCNLRRPVCYYKPWAIAIQYVHEASSSSHRVQLQCIEDNPSKIIYIYGIWFGHDLLKSFSTVFSLQAHFNFQAGEQL